MRSAAPYVLILVIAACVGWLLYYYKSQPEPGETEQHRLPLACASCGKSYDGMIGDEPGKCRFCNKPTVWRAVKCANEKCATIVPWVRNTTSVKAAQPEVICPKCGGKHFNEVMPDDLEPQK